MAEKTSSNIPVFVDVSTGNLFSMFTHTNPELTQPSNSVIQDENTVKNEVQENVPASSTASNVVESALVAKQAELPAKAPKKPDSAQRFRCPECNRFTSSTEEQLLRHVRHIHRGENPYQCYMCDYSTYNSAVFEEHVNIHQGIKPYKCNFCDYSSASKKNTKKHELRHRPDNPLRCKLCGHIAWHKTALASHIRKTHDKNHGVLGKFVCKHCEKDFHDRKVFQRHSRNRFACDLCDFVCCLRSKMTRHKYDVHNTLSGSKPKCVEQEFKCQICTWSSSNKLRVMLHLIHHPTQTVDENVYDVSILRSLEIMK